MVCRVALILPNEQIKFVSIACPNDADPITINKHILRVMDGATPYSVDELRFDHHLADGTLHVAAVALETLNEAEEFAKHHGFSPLSCIARTDADTFPTEVFFGLSDAPLGLMPRLSTEEPEEDVEESAPPVIAFARRDTPEDTTIIASTAPLPVEARVSLTPEPVSPTAKPIAGINDAIVAKQSELGAKIAARIAENNAGQSWRAPALLLLLIALIGGATWTYLRQEPNIAQPEIGAVGARGPTNSRNNGSCANCARTITRDRECPARALNRDSAAQPRCDFTRRNRKRRFGSRG